MGRVLSSVYETQTVIKYEKATPVLARRRSEIPECCRLLLN